MPVGPPSELAPLSEITMIIVLSSSPMFFKEVEQPADVVIGVSEEAGEDFHHAGVKLAVRRQTSRPTPARQDRGARVLRSAGTMPSSFCRAKICLAVASQPSSNLPLYWSAHSFGT